MLDGIRKKQMKFLILVVFKYWNSWVLLRISCESSPKGQKYSYVMYIKFCKQSLRVCSCSLKT